MGMFPDQKRHVALQRILQFKQQYCAQPIILQFQKKKHNHFNPLWLPSYCSPDLYNGIGILTTKNGLILQSSKMLMIISLNVPNERLGQGTFFSTVFQWVLYT